LPNEKHEFFAGWRAAQKGGPAGCTTGWASGLHIKAVCILSWAEDKDGLEGCPFLQPDGPPFLCSPPVRPSVLCAAARQPAENSLFPFGNTALQPARPAGPPISVIRRQHIYATLNAKIFISYTKICSIYHRTNLHYGLLTQIP